MRIDRASPLPVAYQLEVELRRQIERGELLPGQALPTEHALCRRLGISRTPIRRALGRLEAAGLIVRTRGRGTVVAPTLPRTARPAATVTATVLTEAWCAPLQSAANRLAAMRAEQPLRLQFNVVDFSSLSTHLSLAIARGEAPDISLIDSIWVADFAARGALYSLDQISASKAAALSADLLPMLLAANTVDGHLCALPAEADQSLLWYRKDWLAAAGLAPPGTWDEWLALLRYFKRDEARRRFGLGSYPLAFCGGASAGETTTYQLLPVLWSAGADVFGNEEVTLNAPAAIRAVAFIADLVRKHGVASPAVTTAAWNAPALALAAGTVAFALGGSYESSLISAAAGWDEAEFEARIGMLPVPAGPGGHPAAICGGISYGVLRQSRQPQLALELISLAIQPEHWEPLGEARGVNPPTCSGTARLNPATNPLGAMAAGLLPFSRPRWPLIDYPRVSAQIAAMFERAIAGEPPAAAVARAAAVISALTGLPEPGERWRRHLGTQYPLLRIS